MKLKWNFEPGSCQWWAMANPVAHEGREPVYRIDVFGSGEFDLMYTDHSLRKLFPKTKGNTFDTLSEAEAFCQKVEDEAHAKSLQI